MPFYIYSIIRNNVRELISTNTRVQYDANLHILRVDSKTVINVTAVRYIGIDRIMDNS